MIRAAIPLALSGALAACACCTAPDTPQPALLASADEATVSQLKAYLGEALGRADIELGAGDLLTATSVAVLPPPLGPNEGASPVRPVIFDLQLAGSDCEAVRRDTGTIVRLEGIACRPA